MSPKRPPYSDIDLERWRDYDHVWTDSLWLIDARDSSGGHELDYHGNFVPQIATQTFLRYTREDDIVVDLFLGSGTSAIEAARLNRRLIGVDLKPDLIEYVREKIDPDLLDDRIRLLAGDSTEAETIALVREQIEAMGEDHAQLLVLHPPYYDIIQFSEQPNDLSNAPSLETFLSQFEAVAQHGFDLLQPGRFAVLVIGDKYQKGALTPLGFYCLDRMQRAGFRTKAIVVKNIEGNEKGKGRSANLWRYRALAGGYYIFKHEYVIVFQKPEKQVDVRKELQQVKQMPPWSRVQGDEWDRASRFIFSIRSLRKLRRETKRAAAEHDLPLRAFGGYVLRRWYSFHTHQAVLDLILDHPRTRPESDPFHHTVDFYLGDRGVDLKLTQLPRTFREDLSAVRTHPEDLAQWFYENQSKEGRFHTGNRLFVVLHDAENPEQTWELRRDFDQIEKAVNEFLDEPEWVEVECRDRRGGIRRPAAGVVFCVRYGAV